MSLIRDGIPASPGIVVGPAYVLRWQVPRVPHVNVAPEQVSEEVGRFHDARAWARERILEIQRNTAQRLGDVEAQIFEPQLVMLDDPELVEGTVAYIEENHLSAARAFELCMLEYRSEWNRTGHPMVMDRLDDLQDVEMRMLNRLLDLPDPDLTLSDASERVVIVAPDLTPTITVQLDPARILGLATDVGTRTSHSAILARSLNLPAVVSLDDLSEQIRTGDELMLDGRTGRVVVRPSEEEKRAYQDRNQRVQEWEQELVQLAYLDAITPDRQPIQLRANIDMPAEAESARTHGAQGVGLYRTEFLVVGRSIPPEEEEQFRAYRKVAESFPHQAVYIRTFDLGGDKFPLFLHMAPEENPFLGWRGIRVTLDEPELFRTQLRALLRATAVGDVRIMLPLVNEVGEIERTREMLEEEAYQLENEGVSFNPGYKLGIMVETPAAALIATELAQYADFFSVGTNDLVQYTLAVDRGNARLAPLYQPFHPAVVRLLRHVAEAGRAAGIEVSVCGELAAHPLGVFLLLGLGITALSVGTASLPEVKKIIRSIPAAETRVAVEEALELGTAQAVSEALERGLGRWLDLSLLAGRWNLTSGD